MTTSGAPPPELTLRERQVLTIASYGHSNGEITRRLRLSEGTVKSHVRRISTKWRISSRTGLVAYALRSGVIA